MLARLSLAVAILTVSGGSSSLPQVSPHLEDSFESAELNVLPPPWAVTSKGFQATVTDAEAAEGKRSLVLRFVEEKGAPFGNVLQSLDAKPFAGQQVVLSAMVRVESEGAGRAQMWFRVDRPDSKRGAFDNMGDRPIRPGDWTKATIAADVDADGVKLIFGFMSLGHATVHVDDVRLEVKGPSARPPEAIPPRALSERSLQNLEAATRLLAYVRFFDASDACAGVKAWDHVAAALMTQAEDARDASELAKRLSEFFRPISPTLQVWAGSEEKAPPPPAVPAEARTLKHWEQRGAGGLQAEGPSAYTCNRIEEPLSDAPSEGDRWVVKPLGGGACCRLTLQCASDEEGTLPHAKTPEAWTRPEELPKLRALDRPTRLAGVAIAWGVFRHFYPYFDVVSVDWDAALPVALQGAAEDATELDYVRTLREMIAKLKDGHGSAYPMTWEPPSYLPISLKSIGKEFVVVGKTAEAPAEVELGDVLVSIDGRTMEACCSEIAKYVSASSENRKRVMLSNGLIWDLGTADPAVAELRHPDGKTYTARLARGTDPPRDTATKRPENGSEVAPGIVYFDLNGTDDKALASVAAKLDAARGLVFDLRGYPNSAAMTVIQRLITEPAQSARWMIPVVTRPDGEGWTWDERGRWDLDPLTPHWSVPVAFLTDGRAMSYAESILGIVENYELGEIVGSTTAGTNGNVNPFVLPGGIRVSWTGMKVLKHDGSQHHGIGIAPTVPVVPTALGISKGRDEVLEKAVQVVQSHGPSSPATGR